MEGKAETIVEDFKVPVTTNQEINYDTDTSESDEEHPRQRKQRKSTVASHLESATVQATFPCILCPKKFRSLPNLIKHLQRHNPPGGFKCWYCDKSFCYIIDRDKHTDDVHKAIMCRICKTMLNNESTYLEHINQKHDGRDCIYFVCDKCGHDFRSKTQLRVHKESDCGRNKNYKCEMCENSYISKWTLKQHLLSHEDKKFCCSFCGVKFNVKGQLQEHERIHTGEKPFICKFCNKSFAHKKSLVTHVSSHTGVKPYHCKCCQQTFSNNSNLRQHKKLRPDSCGRPEFADNAKSGTKAPHYADSTYEANFQRKPKAKKIIRPELASVNTSKPRRCKQASSGKNEEKREQVEIDEEDIPSVSNMKEEIRSNETVNLTERNIKIDSEPKYKVDQSKHETDPLSQTDFNYKMDTESVAKDFLEVKFDLTANDSNHSFADITVSSAFQNECIDANLSCDWNDDVKPAYLPSAIEESNSTNETKIHSLNECSVFLGNISVKKESKDYDQNNKADAVVELVRKRSAKTLKRSKRVEMQRKPNFYRGGMYLNDGTIECEHCPRTYAQVMSYIKHMVKEHNYNEIEVRKRFKMKPKGRICEESHTCKICGMNYATPGSLKTHILKHGPDGLLIHKCFMCLKYFATLQILRQHAIDSHADRVMCTICNRSYHDPEGLQSHMRNKHMEKVVKVSKKGVKPYICQKCGRSFANHNTLDDHEKSDCGKRPQYKCDICGNFYTSAGILKNHKLVHEDKKLVCSHCGEKFRTPWQLKAHTRTHTGEKPFKCEVCSKSFSHRETLLTHIAQHTGVKRFMCAYCGQRFSCISGLQSHRKARKETCGAQPISSKACFNVELVNNKVFVGIKPNPDEE